jgi:glutamine synthetase
MVIIEEISDHMAHINKGITDMTEARKKANNAKDAVETAHLYCDEVKPFFEDIRYHCDKLEILVDDELWPLTKYRELLFTR